MRKRTIMNLVLLLATSVTMASVNETTKKADRPTLEQIRERVSESILTKELLKLQKDGFVELANNPQLKAKIIKTVELTLKDLPTEARINGEALVSLLLFDPVEAMTRIADLAAKAKDAKLNEKERGNATAGLSLLDIGAGSLRLMSSNPAQAKANKEQCAHLLKFGPEIAKFKSIKGGENVYNNYRKALEENRLPMEAFQAAVKGTKITEKNLPCEG